MLEASLQKDVRWTRSARSSLQRIYSQVASDRPETARRTLESIVDRAHALVGFPELGSAYGYRQGVRILTYGQFRIAYCIDAEHVVVLGVFR